MTRQVLLATRNAKKLRELRAILGEHVAVLGLDDVPEFEELPETGATFEENALIKSEQAARCTGMVSVADDSGLTVDALNGMPGVLSARWSGRHGDDVGNYQLLLGQLGDVPDMRRGAAFVSAVALSRPGAPSKTVRGEWRGRIIREPLGDNGFGYDPIFVPAESDADGSGRSSAQLEPAEKNRLSHRGQALQAILPALTAALNEAD